MYSSGKTFYKFLYFNLIFVHFQLILLSFDASQTYFYSSLLTLIPKVKSSCFLTTPFFGINFWASQGGLIRGILRYFLLTQNSGVSLRMAHKKFAVKVGTQNSTSVSLKRRQFSPKKLTIKRRGASQGQGLRWKAKCWCVSWKRERLRHETARQILLSNGSGSQWKMSHQDRTDSALCFCVDLVYGFDLFGFDTG